jgi:hypothetical protein
LELQETYTKKKNEALIGSIQSIIAEGISKKQSSGSLDQTDQAVLDRAHIHQQNCKLLS